MKIIACDRTHLESIRQILNDAILNTTALYEYQPRSIETMMSWFETKHRGNYPVIGVADDDGELMGFGSYGVFRTNRAYKYTVEHSLYVSKPFRGQGIGKILLHELIAAAQAQEYHVMVGVIDAQNTASIALHKSFGFEHSGTVRQAGYKFGRWLDVAFYQLILATPSKPCEE